ncbi:hypothetical protein LINPERPRIM_LOCUS39417 [Linum perenne]
MHRNIVSDGMYTNGLWREVLDETPFSRTPMHSEQSRDELRLCLCLGLFIILHI